MEYNPTIWVNDDGTGTVGTPAMADNFNNMEQGIKDNTDQINGLNNDLLKYMTVRGFASSNNIYDCTDTGIYLTPTSNVSDLPSGWAQGRCTVVTFNPDNALYGFQLITPYAGNSGAGANRKIAIRHAITSNSYWLEIPTIYDSGWLDLPLASGISSVSGFTCQYRKYGNVCMLRGILTGATLSLGGSNITVATLPSGFRPTSTLMFDGQKSTDDGNYCKFAISSNGSILLKGSNVTITSSNGWTLSSCIFFTD